MHEIFTMLLAVFDRAALMLICLFFLIRLRLFRELLHKSAHTPKELLAVTAIFSLFALFSTWSGVPVEGSLVNVRIIAVMSGGILFGPWVGAIVGAIAGIHRYLIDIDGVTAVPCFITSIVAGLLSGFISRKVPKAQRWKAGILAGMLCETLTMILVVVWAPSLALGIDIVSKIGIPMILGSVCIGFIVLLVGFPQLRRHGQLVVEVGQARIRVEGPRVEDRLGSPLDFGPLSLGGIGLGEVVVDDFDRIDIIAFQSPAYYPHPGHVDIGGQNAKVIQRRIWYKSEFITTKNIWRHKTDRNVPSAL